jgi:DNA invertase Pin-like site-specific DNA recombinase
MSEQDGRSDKITAAHLSKVAYIYIRQSTMGQVTKHKESTELQYGLAKRAERLGWPREAVTIIDEDLGQSGRLSAERRGLQQLISEIGLGRVGIVFSYDASRLARNNKDWYQLLELCTLFDTLIGDSERIYNPSLYHDRLLLGLSGLMSEAELHQLRRRLLAGKRAKAERGELRQRLPVGLVRMPGGEVIQHPDEEVRSRIALVFDKFQELGSANAVTRYCQRANLPLPVRPIDDHDSTAHQWREASRQQILYILHNPAYAGTFAYSQKKHDHHQQPNPAHHTP